METQINEVIECEVVEAVDTYAVRFARKKMK